MQRHRISLREARHAVKAQRLVDHIMASLNTEQLLAIRNEEVVKPDRRLVDFKYFNLRPWLIENIKRAFRLGLEHSRGQRILDIGTGFGYFPYICEFMEHRAVAMDIPGHRLYDRVIETLKIDRSHIIVNAFEPLPAPEARYDYVTAYQLAFNRPDGSERWGASEWAFFLEDTLNHQLAAGGRLHLELNWSFPIHGWYDKDTQQLFDRYGAIRVGNEVDVVKR